MLDMPTIFVKRYVDQSNASHVSLLDNAPMNDDDEHDELAHFITENAQVIGQRLRAMRKLRKLSQFQVGAEAGIKRGTLSGAETGKGIGRGKLVKLAKVLDCPVAVLIGEMPLPNIETVTSSAPNFTDGLDQKPTHELVITLWDELHPKDWPVAIRLLKALGVAGATSKAS